MTTEHPLLASLKRLPLIAILRGLDLAEAAAIGRALVECGFGAIEVPLNRPGALQCIEALVQALPGGVLIGGGTVLTVAAVNDVYAAGGRLMVSPNCNTRVIERAAALGMLAAPGVATPSEAFTALEAGAHALKLFPADMVGQAGLKAMKSVLPQGTELWPVGGITPQSLAPWLAAGATGFGLGSQLWAPGTSAGAVGQQARAYTGAWQAAHQT